MLIKLIALIICLSIISNGTYASSEITHKAATDSTVVKYARNLLHSIVDTSFRGSWVIEPESWDKVEQTTKKIQKTFNSLAQVKMGNTQREVKEVLGRPIEVKNNGKIWVYGTLDKNGTYEELLEVFFDDNGEHVIGVITFDKEDIEKDIGVNIGDPIDKMIAIYGEPVDEKDFIEDPDNKDYLELYYLYPRSGLGFLIGQDKETKNLLVYGILVFGRS